MSRGKRRSASYKDWLTKDGLTKLEGWARDGLTDEQISKNIGIVRSTLYTWRKKYPDIEEALKRGKEVVDIEVENKLLKRAMGYKYKDTKTIREKDEKGNETIRYEEIEKTALPDTTAQIFWLKNRLPERWRNRPTKLDIEEQEAKIEHLKTNTKILKGEGKDIEDLSGIYEEIYGDVNGKD